MSEWLRRQTRNLLGFACAGSNPAVDDFNFILFLFFPFISSIGRPIKRVSPKLCSVAMETSPLQKGSLRIHGSFYITPNLMGDTACPIFLMDQQSISSWAQTLILDGFKMREREREREFHQVQAHLKLSPSL
jgi:hypothetical protein